MAFQTYLDEFGVEIQQLVASALSELGKNPRDFYAIEQYEDSSPRVTLRLGQNNFRKFVIRDVFQSLSPEQRRMLVFVYVDHAYRTIN
jgi:hypothetical protein